MDESEKSQVSTSPEDTSVAEKSSITEKPQSSHSATSTSETLPQKEDTLPQSETDATSLQKEWEKRLMDMSKTTESADDSGPVLFEQPRDIPEGVNEGKNDNGNEGIAVDDLTLAHSRSHQEPLSPSEEPPAAPNDSLTHTPEPVSLAPAEPEVIITASGEKQFIDRRRQWGRRKTDRIRRYVVSAVTVGAILIVILALRYLSNVLVPFAAAFILAYLLNPIANKFHQMTQNRILAVGCTVVILVVAVGLFSWQVFPLAAQQSKEFITNLNTTWQNVQSSAKASKLDFDYFPTAGTSGKSETGWKEFVDAWRQYISNREIDQPEAITMIREATRETFIGGGVDSSIQFIQNRPFNDMINRAFKQIFINGTTALLYLVALISLGGIIIVAALYLVLLLSDFPDYTRVLQSFLPEHFRTPLVEFMEEYHGVMGQYLVRQAGIAIATGVLFTIGFTAAKLPLAIPMGMAMGFLSMIPYLQLAGIAPILVLAIMYSVQQRLPLTPLLLGGLAVFVVIQLVQELILKPFIGGRSKGIERMGILLGAFLWPTLLGWLGFLVAIPFTCLIIAGYRCRANRLAAATTGTEQMVLR